MRTWTVHLPREAAPGDPAAYDRAILVRDGFVWSAFFFSVLWMLWHRLWLAAILTLAVFLGLSWGLPEFEIGEGPAMVISLLVSILIGLEASTIRRWTYERRGLPVRDVVAAPDYDRADALACARFLARGEVAPPPVVAPAVVPAPAMPAPVDFGKRPPRDDAEPAATGANAPTSAADAQPAPETEPRA